MTVGAGPHRPADAEAAALARRILGGARDAVLSVLDEDGFRELLANGPGGSADSADSAESDVADSQDDAGNGDDPEDHQEGQAE